MKPSPKAQAGYSRIRALAAAALLSLVCVPARASETLDALYRLRTICPVVLNYETYPVFGEFVEKELAKSLSSRHRFEVPPSAPGVAREQIAKLPPAAMVGKEQERLEAMTPVLDALAAMGVDGLLLAEIRSSSNDFRVAFHLITTRTRERLYSSQQSAGDGSLLDNFRVATEAGVRGLVTSLPYDANVIKREGYRVILDRGAPDVKPGDRVTTQTVEKTSEGLILAETGTLEITQAEPSLSFAKIVVEKKPREVLEGNKVWIPNLHPVGVADASEAAAAQRAPAALLPQGPRRQLGFVGLDLGANFVNMNTLTSGGAGASSGNVMYPGGKLAAELWITSRFYVELDFQLALAVLGNSGGGATKLNSNITGFRGMVGYVLPIDKSEMSPVVRVKLGLARREYKVDTSSDPLGFVTTAYSGLQIGGAVNVPINSRWTASFDLNTNFLQSVSESPVTSGSEMTGSSGFDFTFQGTYRYSPLIDLHARLYFGHNSANFSGQGTRPTPVASTTQSVRALLAGLSYYF